MDCRQSLIFSDGGQLYLQHSWRQARASLWEDAAPVPPLLRRRRSNLCLSSPNAFEREVDCGAFMRSYIQSVQTAEKSFRLLWFAWMEEKSKSIRGDTQIVRIKKRDLQNPVLNATAHIKPILSSYLLSRSPVCIELHLFRSIWPRMPHTFDVWVSNADSKMVASYLNSIDEKGYKAILSYQGQRPVLLWRGFPLIGTSFSQ